MADLHGVKGSGGSLLVPPLGDAVGGSSNRDLMEAARLALSGNWGMAVLGYVLYGLLVGSFSLFTFGAACYAGAVCGVGGADAGAATGAIQKASQLVQFLVSGPVMVGLCGFFLGIAQEGEARLELLFTGFRRFWKSFGVYFLYSLFVILWTLLLVVPGIIAAFRYAMAFFIVADDADCGALDAIRRSKEMMRGNKWKFFCLHWRFFWWGLLCLVLPIGFLWLVPYMQAAFAKFYEDVK